MQWFYFALIGAAAGWLVAWVTDKKGARVVKPIGIGVAGGVLGGGAIEILLVVFKALAPMVGAALGAMVVLSFVSKRSSSKLGDKK